MRRARWMTTANFWLYCLPYFAVSVRERASMTWAPGVILGVGLGGYAALVLLSAGVVPPVLRRMGRPVASLRWLCAAVGGTFGSLVLVVTGTVLHLPYGSLWARLAVGSTLALALDAGRDAIKRRHFDQKCTWP